jgi:hypothetical protein
VVWSVRVDHTRRKRDATLSYLNEIRPLWRTQRRDLDRRLASAQVKGSMVSVILGDEGLHWDVQELLSHMEMLSVGVLSGVFDISIVDRASGGSLIAIYDTMTPYIDNRRETLNAPTLYVEFEELIGRLRKRRQ